MLHVFEEVDQGRYEVVNVAEEVGEKKECNGECGIRTNELVILI